jgi:hypothetical protein
VLGSKHLSEHSKKNLESEEYREQNKKQLESISRLAAAWHSSEEGAEWHRNHINNSLAKAWEFREQRKCKWCGKEYTAKTKRAKFCHYMCKQKAANYQKEQKCQKCGNVFRYQYKRKLCDKCVAEYRKNVRRYSKRHKPTLKTAE